MGGCPLPRRSGTPRRDTGWQLDGKSPVMRRNQTVSSAGGEASVGHPPGVGRSSSSSPLRGFRRVPRSEVGASGPGKSKSSRWRSPLGTSWVSGRHRHIAKLLEGFCFLQQWQFTSWRQSSPPPCRLCRPPGDGGGHGATLLRKRLCCRAQPLNSVTFREPHTCSQDLWFARESSSQRLTAHPQHRCAPSAARVPW